MYTMRTIDILRTNLENLADKEHYMFSISDFYCLFDKLSKSALTMLLSRAVKNKILVRACKGIYIYPKANYDKGYELYHIASKLRCDEFCYLSLETILSQYGIISQMPIGYISVMTTGRHGIIDCGNYGKIEFIHTKKNIEKIKSKLIYNYKYKLWCAKPELSYTDMRDTQRPLDLINEEILNEYI